MSKTGWLINDCLTCIPGTKTFWYYLLEHIPGLVDKCDGYTSYNKLATTIETALQHERPDYIIRNGAYFRTINTNIPTISFIQDITRDRQGQASISMSSTTTVFNSIATRAAFADIIPDPVEIIPIGVDFEIFRPYSNPEKEQARIRLNILPNSILFVGSSLQHPKGFDTLRDIITYTNHNFCLVMKDAFTMSHPRVRVFNRVPTSTMVDIYNACAMLICTSIVETQHLAGMEAASCDIPIATTNVGIYVNMESSKWGIKVPISQLPQTIMHILNNRNLYSPRSEFINKEMSIQHTMDRWKQIIDLYIK